ncbi:MAG: hypothetical protein ACJ8DJ_13890 [Gemmatimonadales bacterium]
MVESPTAGGWVIELSLPRLLLLVSTPVLGLYPLVPLVSELIPESCLMLEVSGVVGTAELVLSVGVVGY